MNAKTDAPDMAALAGLLCTRLCHDLSGSVGAVSAGVELLADEADSSFLAETVALLRHSADASSARLKFLRAAFGTGTGAGVGAGAGAGAGGNGAAPRPLLLAYVDSLGSGVRVEWRPHADAAEITDGAAARLLLNLCLAGLDGLSGSGGTLTVELLPGGRFAVTAEGPRAALDPAARAALLGDGRGLTPRTAQAFLLHLLAAPGGGVIVDEMAGRVVLGAAFMRTDAGVVNQAE